MLSRCSASKTGPDISPPATQMMLNLLPGPHPGRRQSQYSWAQMDPSAHSLAFRGGAEVPDEVTANIVGGQQV